VGIPIDPRSCARGLPKQSRFAGADRISAPGPHFSSTTRCAHKRAICSTSRKGDRHATGRVRLP
jgi:hypothetical protein